MSKIPTIGILGLQGCISPHEDKLDQVGVLHLRVMGAADLALVDGLILPGGESTTMLKLLDSRDMWTPLKRFSRLKPCWGICAGSILLATSVENPRQKSLGAIEILARRNAYGSQKESFKGTIDLPQSESSVQADFIRAPELSALSARVETLATYKGNPVGFIQNNCIATAFHTELGRDTLLHEEFVTLVKNNMYGQNANFEERLLRTA